MEKRKIQVKLVGGDGNAFDLIGKVSAALKKAGQREQATAFVAKAFVASSYEELLVLIQQTVEVS